LVVRRVAFLARTAFRTLRRTRRPACRTARFTRLLARRALPPDTPDSSLEEAGAREAPVCSFGRGSIHPEPDQPISIE